MNTFKHDAMSAIGAIAWALSAVAVAAWLMFATSTPAVADRWSGFYTGIGVDHWSLKMGGESLRDVAGDVAGIGPADNPVFKPGEIREIRAADLSAEGMSLFFGYSKRVAKAVVALEAGVTESRKGTLWVAPVRNRTADNFIQYRDYLWTQSGFAKATEDELRAKWNCCNGASRRLKIPLSTPVSTDFEMGHTLNLKARAGALLSENVLFYGFLGYSHGMLKFDGGNIRRVIDGREWGGGVEIALGGPFFRVEGSHSDTDGREFTGATASVGFRF